MKQKPRIYYSDSQKALMWERWRKGEVMNNLNGLWDYATTEWLRLTLPNADDKIRSRWPIHPL